MDTGAGDAARGHRRRAFLTAAKHDGGAEAVRIVLADPLTVSELQVD